MHHGLGGADLPGRVHVLIGSALLHLGNMKEANTRILRRANHIAAFSSRPHGPLHIRLAGTDPDVANENVLQDDAAVLPLDLQLLAPLLGGLELLESDAPVALVVRLDGFLRAAEAHRDLFTRLSPAPDRHRHVALEHHVAAEDAGQLDIGARRRVNRKNEGSHQRCKQYSGIHPVPFSLGFSSR